MSLKATKEAFVAGLPGTSKLEIFAIIATLSLSIVICEHAKSRQRPRQGLALELLLVMCPQLLIYTGALPLWPTLLAFTAAATACFVWDATHASRVARHELPDVDELAGPRKSFIGLFRGALMAATCLCILAVDFRAFPRRYAKAEAYGTGYMDVGVGGVILTAGLVSPASRRREPRRRGDGGSEEGDGGRELHRWRPSPPFWRRLVAGLRSSAACWVLGLARMAATRAVDYQAHVGEYGVHWNFFHTIAVVTLLGHAVVGALPPERLAAAAVAVTAGHQAALSLGGLGRWVMSASRGPDLLSANKEGLVSCVGFAAVYLWGAALAHVVHETVQPAVRHLRTVTATMTPATGAAPPGSAGGGAGGGNLAAGAAAPLLQWWAQLVALDGMLWVVLAVLEAGVERVSRRSCNAAYIVWTVAQCLAGILPLALWQALATASGAAFAASNAAAAAHPGRDGGRGGDSGSSASADGAPPFGDRKRREGTAAPRRRRHFGVPGLGVASGGDRRRDELASSAPSPLSQSSPAGKAGPRVLQAINSHQLLVFLAANLMTGAVNLTVDTLQVSDWSARALLAVYISCVCGLALALDACGWRLKL